MAQIKIEVDEATLKGLVVSHLMNMLGDVSLEMKDVTIETKSKQNYRSEWESAAFRAIVVKTV